MRYIVLSIPFLFLLSQLNPVYSQNRLSSSILSHNIALANNGNMHSQYLVGMHYLSVSKNGSYKKTGRRWLKLSADQGKPEAQYEYAKEMFRDRTRESDAIAYTYFKKSSRQGNYNAALELAKMYYFGFGTLKYLNRAFDLFKICAQADNKEAQYYLASMLLKGEGTEANPNEAFNWCAKSAKQNYSPAQLLLGKMYFNGSGTSPDPNKAAEQIKKAHWNKNPDAEAFWDKHELWKYTN